MNSQSISRFSFFHLVFTIKFLVLGSSYPDGFYQTCGNTFSCGNTITGIGYPFRGFNNPPYCGHPGLVLSCDHQNNATNIDILGTNYRVLEIDQTTQTMRIVREDLMDQGTTNYCPREIVNTTLDFSIFEYVGDYTNFTFLYGCRATALVDLPAGSRYISCGYDGVYVLPGTHGPGNCNASVIVPVPVSAGGSANDTGLGQVLQEGFLIMWKIGSKACSDCTASNGRCGYDFATNETTCFCPDPPYVSDTCPMANVASPPAAPMTPSRGK